MRWSIVRAPSALGKLTPAGRRNSAVVVEGMRQSKRRRSGGGRAQMATIDDILTTIDAGHTAALDRLFAFLSIPSISAIPAHFPDCERAADWLVAELAALGFEAAKRRPPAGPMVVGHIKASRRDSPHVLFYGHYDVQPVDPARSLALAAVRAQARGRAARRADRGARRLRRQGPADDLPRGLPRLPEFGGPPCAVTALFEGEEETGSPSLPPFPRENAKELKADVALVCDTGMWNASTPAITTALRGIVADEVILTGANRDLHSGVYGGAAVNPIHALARILGALHDDNGAVALPGFYDGVEELPQDITTMGRARCRRQSLPRRRRPDDARRRARPHAARAGLVAPDLRGQRRRRRLHRRGDQDRAARQGERQSVVPAGRRAEPRAHRPGLPRLRRPRLPPDVKAEFIGHGGSPAITLPIKNEALRRARRALEAEWGKPAVLIGAAARSRSSVCSSAS